MPAPRASRGSRASGSGPARTPGLGPARSRPDQHQRGHGAPAAAGQAEVGHHQVDQVLALLVAAHVEQAPAGQPAAGQHLGHLGLGQGLEELRVDPIRDDGDLLGRDVEQQVGLAGRVLRDADHAVGGAHVVAHQRHVVAADLGPRHVGVLEEEQVVQRHDLARASPRHEQRGGGVHQVEGRADQQVERRPGQVVPAVVEGPHRQAPVDQAHVGGPRPLRVALPHRGREVEEAILGCERRQARGEGQHVGPDAGRARQRGAHVEAEVRHGRSDDSRSRRASRKAGGRRRSCANLSRPCLPGAGALLPLFRRTQRLEDRSGRHGLRGPGRGGLLRRERQQRGLRRHRRRQDRCPASGARCPSTSPGSRRWCRATWPRGACASPPTSPAAVRECDMLFIAVGTPAGRGRLGRPDRTCSTWPRGIGQAMNGYKIVVTSRPCRWARRPRCKAEIARHTPRTRSPWWPTPSS